jgi:hypothetical protein
MYDLRDQLLALDPEERANLLALIEHKEAQAPFQPSRADDEVWTALIRVSPPGAAPWRKLDGFLKDKQHGVPVKAWREAVAALGAFAAEVAPVRRRDEDRAALVDLALDCLAADLKHAEIQVTPKALLAALPQLHRAIDRAFPGYAQAGLLPRLIRLAPRTEID